MKNLSEIPNPYLDYLINPSFNELFSFENNAQLASYN